MDPLAVIVGVVLLVGLAALLIERDALEARLRRSQRTEIDAEKRLSQMTDRLRRAESEIETLKGKASD
jgi:TolA-binding protein